MAEKIKIETFENANGFRARIEGDTHAKVFGDVQYSATRAQAARDCAIGALSENYQLSDSDIRMRHIGNGVYIASRK